MMGGRLMKLTILKARILLFGFSSSFISTFDKKISLSTQMYWPQWVGKVFERISYSSSFNKVHFLKSLDF